MTRTDAWVVADEDQWFAASDNDRIDILPEKKRYEPGGAARFQVRTPFREATALVTVEREGSDKPVCVAESLSRNYGAPA